VELESSDPVVVAVESLYERTTRVPEADRLVSRAGGDIFRAGGGGWRFLEASEFGEVRVCGWWGVDTAFYRMFVTDQCCFVFAICGIPYPGCLMEC
jgi:hypothetical protein